MTQHNHIRHFLDLDQLDPATLRALLDRAAALKAAGRKRLGPGPLDQRTLAMIFEKASTRTRLSFELAMGDLGGRAIVLNAGDLQLGRGETVADTARVLSRYVDAIMLRTSDHAKLLELARHASVPVINGLTDRSHPCQVLADIVTVEERLGPIDRLTVAWSGDCNNVLRSWLHAAALLKFALRIAAPKELCFDKATARWWRERGADVTIGTDPRAAVAGADVVATDVWVSMGDDAQQASRHALLSSYRVDEALMDLAAPRAIFLHCLPARRGEEVTAGVIDGPRSAVWDEAENRLHAQKSVLEWCLAA